METAVKEKSRTGLSDQAGVQDNEQDVMVADGSESGKENFMEVEIFTDNEAESVDREFDRRWQNLTFWQKERALNMTNAGCGCSFEAFYILLMKEMEEVGVKRIEIVKGIDPERFAEVCQGIGKLRPESFALLVQRLEDHVF